MRAIYCTCAFLLVLFDVAAAQQTPAPPASTGYTVFLRGNPVGREEISVRSDSSGTVITSQGRLSGPFNSVLRNAETRYQSDWTPTRFQLSANTNGVEVRLETTFADGMATTTGAQDDKAVNITHQVSPQALVMPTGIFGAFAGLAKRLAARPADDMLRLYVVPVAEIGARVVATHEERMQMGTAVFGVRRYELALSNPGGDLAVNLTAGEDGSLIRVSIPAQALDVVREDVAASTSRTQVYSNPGDQAVIIPAAGFNLGATITLPGGAAAPGAAKGERFPAVILVAESGVGDRDGASLGIPIVAQLAGALADAGFLAVRYDKRGYGQSGGRAESATLGDYAEDVRAVTRWLADRKDVDNRRIAVIGHGDGAAVALLAAARERRRITAVASIASPAATGVEWNLEQQRYALDRLNLTAAEREAKVAEQKQIQAAVLTGRGWDQISPELREAADTPLFQSLLRYEPEDVLDDIRQPLLIVHGELDKEVPVAHADRLAALAREESDSKSVEVVIVRGVNHLLVPAATGEVGEYTSLTDRNVSKDVIEAITGWLTRTFQAIR